MHTICVQGGGGSKKAEKLRVYYINGPVDQIAVKTPAKLRPKTNLMGIFHTESKINKVLLSRRCYLLQAKENQSIFFKALPIHILKLVVTIIVLV